MSVCARACVCVWRWHLWVSRETLQEPVPFPLSATTSAFTPSQGGGLDIKGAVRQETETEETGLRSELPTCFEVTVRNPMLSPPQVGRILILSTTILIRGKPTVCFHIIG